ncbi:MAG: hypothetical protein A3G49_00160 [Candidatus Sungbacteria bacterium RIFCSPLOWO2_12_FULL_41_11]|uniref:Uncharacterized protein n=1 Tax=Candidatus Sungbacteria bacterium RIFCSPLOWO2_12_FULL_41_11 TaxID=1802286 RepID=A0A1G2LMC2_9BACT|nr:MAG: hypothetical protein A3G49_00160 [Candidatus Sungbacteria bacterium RIFCSPLOWO2_12_FULL_41_11]
MKPQRTFRLAGAFVILLYQTEHFCKELIHRHVYASFHDSFFTFGSRLKFSITFFDVLYKWKHSFTKY